MTAKIFCIDADEWLHAAKSLFEQHKFHHLLVTSDKQLVAILSARDLFKVITPQMSLNQASAKDLAALNRPVISIATKPVISVGTEDSLSKVVTLFQEKQVSCLPVVNDQGRPVGKITMKDIVRLLYKKIHSKSKKS